MAKKKPALTGIRRPSVNFNFGANVRPKKAGKRKSAMARAFGGGS
jgi:hypothetical protein